MFFVTGDYSVTFITADQLRIELKAGGLNQKQEDHVIGHILQSSEKGEVGDLVLTSVGKTDGSCTFDYNSHGSLKTRLHRRFLSQQLDANFCRAKVATSKSQVQTRCDF